MIFRPPAGRRPEAGSEVHIVLALGQAGRISARSYTSLCPVWDQILTKSLIFARFYKGLAPKRGSEMGARPPASRQAGRPAGGREIIISFFSGGD